MLSSNYSLGCNFGLGCGYNYSPCQHIEDVMEKLDIKERNDENDKRIKEYLFNNCCNKHYSKFDYFKYFIIKLINEKSTIMLKRENVNVHLI